MLGEPVRVRDGVRMFGVVTEAHVGKDGTLVYVPGDMQTDNRSLVWVDRDGRQEPIAAPPGPYRAPRLSPDGTRVAVEIARPGSNDISVYNLARGTLTPLTSDGGLNFYPIWTPDGQEIVFGSVRDTDDGRLSFPVRRVAADGSGDAELIYEHEDRILIPQGWSAGGGTLVFNDFLA